MHISTRINSAQKSLAFITLLGLSLAACAPTQNLSKDAAPATKQEENLADNPYTSHYVSSDLPVTSIEKNTEAPKLYLGKDKELDAQSMLENGYDLLGFSSFKAGDVPITLLTEQASKVHADTVLVYTEITAQALTSTKVQQLHDEQRLKDNPELAKLAKPIVKNHDNYAYYAAYWVKLLPPTLGLHVKAPQTGDTDTGVVIEVVINNSPAQYAGLLTNDLLLSIGDVVMSSPQALVAATKRYAGKTVEVMYQREGKREKTEVTLNQPR